jgi:hypothetical protein
MIYTNTISSVSSVKVPATIGAWRANVVEYRATVVELSVDCELSEIGQ